MENTQNFCPTCQSKMLNSHLVQCENCQSILNFLPLMENEEAVIFYTSNCSECSIKLTDKDHSISSIARDFLI